MNEDLAIYSKIKDLSFPDRWGNHFVGGAFIVPQLHLHGQTGVEKSDVRCIWMENGKLLRNPISLVPYSCALFSVRGEVLSFHRVPWENSVGRKEWEREDGSSSISHFKTVLFSNMLLLHLSSFFCSRSLFLFLYLSLSLPLLVWCSPNWQGEKEREKKQKGGIAGLERHFVWPLGKMRSFSVSLFSTWHIPNFALT